MQSQQDKLHRDARREIEVILHRDFITTQIGASCLALRGVTSKISPTLQQSKRE